MKRHVWVVALVCVLAAGASAQQNQQKPAEPPQQPPVFRAEATYVRVDVFPTKDGRPVQGLRADDFEVFEDGVLQKIAAFEHVFINTGTPPDARIEPNSVREGERMAANPRNRVFVVFLDVPHVEVSSSHAIKEPVIRLLGRMMGPDDLVAVMTPSMAPTQMTFARKSVVIEQQLREHWPWGERSRVSPMDERETQYELCYPPEPGQGGVSPLAQALKDRRRERMVLEAMHDMVGYLGGIREERKAIIVVTEGWRLYTPNRQLMELQNDREEPPGRERIGVGPDGRLRRNPPTTRTENISTKYECDTDRMALAAIDNERYFRDLLDDANRANASFYPVDPRGLPVFDESIGPRQPLSPHASQARLRDKLEILKTLAENTDGLPILNNNDLDAGLKRVSDDLTSYYLLGYYSSNTKLDGTFRTLKVRVKTPGVSVRARRGYRAATAEEVNAARAASSAAVPAGAAAAGEAIAELARIRPDLPFVVRAVPAAPAGTAEMPGVWVAGELQGKDTAAGGTATIEISAGGVTSSAKAELKPGERAFLIKVPLQKSSAQADVRARFVPGSSGVTIPMTYTARVGAPGGLTPPVIFRRGPTTGNRLQPVAGFQFSRSERARLEVPLGAGDKPGEGRLLDKAGKPLQIPVAISERTEAESGQRWMVADLTLAALGAGEYAIELSADTRNGRKSVLTAVRVTR
jgi:VWFA-related protein